MECLSCKSLSGEQPITTLPRIFDGKFWVIEHAYPVSLQGWLVIVLKRHAEALHELEPEEFAELAQLQAKASRALFQYTNCAKEYLACFAEKPGFNHVHIHVVARSADLPGDLLGPRIFSHLAVSAETALPEPELGQFCLELRQYFS